MSVGEARIRFLENPSTFTASEYLKAAREGGVSSMAHLLAAVEEVQKWMEKKYAPREGKDSDN